MVNLCMVRERKQIPYTHIVTSLKKRAGIYRLFTILMVLTKGKPRPSVKSKSELVQIAQGTRIIDN